jgi:phosphatidate cytidylyltransferase
MALNFKTLITRTLTAAVFVAVLLTCINFNFITFAGLFLIVSIWGLYEFYQLSEKLGAKPYKPLGYLAGICIFIYGVVANSNLALYFPTEKIFAYILVFIFFVFIIGLFDESKNTLLNITHTLTGLVYTVLPYLVLVNIACIDKTYILNNHSENWYNNLAPYNPHYVLGILLLIWASDVCAYLVGSLIGKNKLYERISPGKTWEGSIGATILTIGCSFLISKWYPELALKHWIIISIIVSVFGTIGDLVESMFKRQAGVKDSGKIMPGHGGILDRFDSLLFVSPFVYAYLILI